MRLFKDYAPVNSIRLRSAGGKVLHKHKQRKESGSLNGYVVLKDKATAEKSVALNGVEFKGHHLRVTLASKSPQHHEQEESKRTVFVGNLKYCKCEVKNMLMLSERLGLKHYFTCSGYRGSPT